MNDPGFAIGMEERRRLLEANASAARFFRRELLRATGGWPLEYVKDARIEQVLSVDSTWQVGYAPPTATALVDHLRAEKFQHSTMVRAGLVAWTDDGEAVDRFQDQLVLVTRDVQLTPTGFVGIGSDGQARLLDSDTGFHQPSNGLVGIHEQIDLLRDGAIPVLVEHPVDAIAVSNMSRQLDGQWAGIPVCGAGLSTAQARMLRKFSLGDQAIVILTGDDHHQKLTSGYLLDLALYYDRIRAVLTPYSPRTFESMDGGAQLMDELLTTARPVLRYRFGGAGPSELILDPEPPDPGPGL
ncbi:hypothetical protein [Kribbella speibonae]|uniref:DNA primase DNAG catalytic core N-terminal domain-containing protein n=1 Tax=Kribbella speibonae TaxID=1572660 RepID=A0A4R0J594_9ACTN|nr:hypothetical protein [Kribbella speibonae]TCC36485.1 hypothetical protein E0H92_28055 [Kribbella speibonae]